MIEINYYLDETQEENLYCRLSDDTGTSAFALGYEVDSADWDEENEEVSPDDPFFYTLMSFREYLANRYEELSSSGLLNIPAVLKSEVETLTEDSGIRGIARKMFDEENSYLGIPAYDEFIKAFEKFSGLEPDEYEALAIDNTVEFVDEEGGEFQLDTAAGLTARLRSFIEKKSYAEIGMMTSKFIWSKIYNETGGIEKHIFLPEMLLEWETFWDNEYEAVAEAGGNLEELPRLKERSWRRFQVFISCFSDNVDIVQLAFEIDDMELYPMTIITMLRIFDPEACYEAYNEAEFGEDWEVVESDGVRFFVKEGEE
jgi:hypothetical protein